MKSIACAEAIALYLADKKFMVLPSCRLVIYTEILHRVALKAFFYQKRGQLMTKNPNEKLNKKR
jgi:hypothetical protein